jgi:2-dehydro-3-deoxyphosphogluconate aldolase/(4S)-4-hydroxy-2-oxoglutarate aldolase
MNLRILSQIEEVGIIAVLVIDRVEDAVPVARALVEGGINVMELTLRTPAAVDALREIKTHVPEMVAGIGTILSLDQVETVKAAGADFGVSPGLNRVVAKEAQQAQLPFMPGVVTPSDIEQALELDCRYLKFFPAEPAGGLDYLKSMAAPYAHLGVRYIPLGGVNIENARTYLESPLILAVGGSWIAPRGLINDQDWKRITNNAQEGSNMVQQLPAKGKK